MTIKEFKNRAKKHGDYTSSIPNVTITLIGSDNKAKATVNLTKPYIYSYSGKSFTDLIEDNLVWKLAKTPISKR